MSNRAWVTLATNDSYGLGALVLANSLRRAGSIYPAAVLITPSVTEAMSQRLRAVFAEVVTVDVLDSRDAAHLALLQRPELGITFTKIHCWGLTQYEKCVFLDADTLVVQNCDELFEREELSAAPDVGWPDCFNSGVFVYKPSQATFDQLIKFAQERGSFDGGDQGLLNSFFSDWAQGDSNKRLPFLYNVTSAAFYSYLPALKHYGQNLKIIHFIGATKPWLQQFNWESRSVDAPDHLREFLQLWWDLFVGQVHPQLDVSMSGVAGNLARVVPGAVNTQREAIDELTRRQGWEAGNIDYMGADSFDNIWAKISQTLSQPRQSPPKQPSPPKQQSPPKEPPVEVAQEATVVDAPSAPETVPEVPATVEPTPAAEPVAPAAAAPVVEAPVSVELAPVVEAAAKVEAAPAPVEASPAPVEAAPAPVDAAPAPVEAAPAPVEAAPAPVEAAPAPVKATPAPSEAAQASAEAIPLPAPAAATPAPVETAPAQTEAAPLPAEVASVPVEAAPVSAEAPPAVPAPAEAAPVPAEAKPVPTKPAPAETAVAPAPAKAEPVPTPSPEATPQVEASSLTAPPAAAEATTPEASAAVPPASVEVPATVEAATEPKPAEIPATVEAIASAPQAPPETPATVEASAPGEPIPAVASAPEPPKEKTKTEPVLPLTPPASPKSPQERVESKPQVEAAKVPSPASPVLPKPAKPEATPEKPSEAPGCTDSPPLANTPSKDEAPTVPAAKSTEEAAQETRL